MGVTLMSFGSERDRVIAVSEKLLAFQAEVFPELAVPSDTHAQECVEGSNDAHDSLRLFDYLAVYGRAFEDHLFEGFETVTVGAKYQIVFTAYDDIDVECRAYAVVHDGDESPWGMVLDLPTVHRLILACAERPLADCVRVFAYVVRCFCELIGPIRDLSVLDADFVRAFGESVGVLRDLVRAMRLEQRDDGADRANGRNDDTQQISDFHVQDSNEEAVK